MLSIIMAVLIFGIIVLVHEFGHFLLAKLNGVGVIEFSIGMGPRLVHFTKGETKYSIKALPIGGSCMMLGEDESAADEKAFTNKSVWARMSVIVAGPIFNFILAFIFALILVSFNGYDPAKILQVTDGSPAQEAGILPGDTITRVNGEKVVVYRDFFLYTLLHPGETMEIEVERQSENQDKATKHMVTVTPKFSEEAGRYLIGTTVSGYNVPTASLGETLKYSLYEVQYNITSTIKSLGMLITGKASLNDLSGPVGIVVMIDDSVKAGMTVGIGAVLLNILNMSILLSANLGVMNLLPLPALDGGRLVFLIIEAFRGKAIDPEKEGMVHVIGMVALMALMIFVLFNDFRRFF